jgi:ABC-2 type transport system ATP-binding protein
MNDVIATHSLSKHYRGLAALDDLSFTVPRGAIYGLVGENGAGKTTTLDLLMNLQAPSSGEATVLGTDSRRLQGECFRQIGYVADNQDQPGWMTVPQLFAHLKPLYPEWDDERAADLMAQFRLPADRRIRSLSRGMRMKAALASSMAFRPRLLVLDEPFTGLDPLTREELIGALLETAEAMTVVLSSHDINDIETFVSHIGYLNQGRLEFSEELTSLLARSREIVVTARSPRLPVTWPAHWLCPEVSSAAVRFVDVQFDARRTPGELTQAFSEITDVEISAISLRSLLVNLIRAQVMSTRENQ